MIINKDKSLISYIISKRLECTITEIVKLCYLIDLSHYKNKGKKISTYNYIRYFYGPYDKQIDDDVKDLVLNGFLSYKIIPTPYGEEYVTYCVLDDKLDFQGISKEEAIYIDSALEQLSGFRSTQLTTIAYESRPMKKFGAVLGGSEHLLEALDFDA